MKTVITRAQVFRAVDAVEQACHLPRGSASAALGSNGAATTSPTVHSAPAWHLQRAKMTRSPCWRSGLTSTIFGTSWSGRPIRSRPAWVLALSAGHHSAQHGQGSGATSRSLTRGSRPTQRHPAPDRDAALRPVDSASTLDARALSRARYARSGAGYSAFESRFKEPLDSGLAS